MSRLSRTMKAKIRKHGVQKKEIGGLISQAWGMLDEIGAAGKADYAETDKYGALKNPTKNTVGGIIGAVIDPISFLTDVINGESFIGAKSRGEKLARQNKMKEVAANAQIQNQAGAAADQYQMKKNEVRLAKGGIVRRKHAVGGIVKRMKNKPEAFKPKAKMIGSGIEGWLQGKWAGGEVDGDIKKVEPFRLKKMGGTETIIKTDGLVLKKKETPKPPSSTPKKITTGTGTSKPPVKRKHPVPTQNKKIETKFNAEFERKQSDTTSNKPPVPPSPPKKSTPPPVKGFHPPKPPPKTPEQVRNFADSLYRKTKHLRRNAGPNGSEVVKDPKKACLDPSEDGYTRASPAGSTGSVIGKAKGGVVTGKPGIDTNLATLKEGSFVIPTTALKGEQGKIVRQAMKKFGYDKPLQKAQGGDVPVLLTEREYVIEPHKKDRIAAYLKTKGIPSLESLAPNAEDGNAKNTGGNVKRYQELQMKSLHGIHLTEEEQSELNKLGETIKTEKRNEVAENVQDTKDAQERVDAKMKSTVEKSIGPNALKFKSDTFTPPTKSPKTGNTKSGTTTDMIAGGIQTGVGMIGMATMGKDPLVKADQEGLFEDRFVPAVTQNVLARLDKLASFGMDPRTKEVLMQGANDQYAQESGMAREGSGSSAELFNRRSSSGLNKLRAMNDISMKDAELKQGKQMAAANAGLEADRMFANRYDANKALKIRKTELQHGEWQKEAENWGSLINSGMATMTEAPRINRFYSDLMQYPNAY